MDGRTNVFWRSNSSLIPKVGDIKEGTLAFFSGPSVRILKSRCKNVSEILFWTSSLFRAGTSADLLLQKIELRCAPSPWQRSFFYFEKRQYSILRFGKHKLFQYQYYVQTWRLSSIHSCPLSLTTSVKLQLKGTNTTHKIQSNLQNYFHLSEQNDL